MTLIKTWFNKRKSMDLVSCEICLAEYEQRTVDTKFRRSGKIANGRDLCIGCTHKIHIENLVINGTKALKKITGEEKKRLSSAAGKKSAETYDPTKNKSRFSTSRWEQMSPEQQHSQVKKASDALQEKLKDPIFAAKHYAKIFGNQTSIGYMSKGHKELHKFIENMGFISHFQISEMQVDECNDELKIVIEYNGDMWHCNPRKWTSEQYNSAIKMTAGEKWTRDIVRYAKLKSLGYTVLVIWESSWIDDPQRYLDRIKETCNEISIKARDTETNLLRSIC